MANTSIFSLKTHRANLQRNAFDLSMTSKFTASAGMLLPCYVADVNPNEHFRINPSLFLRTTPMNAASFVRLKQYCEFFFVPYRLLWRPWQSFITGTWNRYSNALADASTITGVPYITPSTHIKAIVSDTSSYDTLGFDYKNGAVRLLDLLGYGVNYINADGFKETTLTNKLNPFRLLAYQKIYNDYYRNAEYEYLDPGTYNVDTLGFSSIGYNKQMFTLRYRYWKKDYFNALSPRFQGSEFTTGTLSPLCFTGDGVNPIRPATIGSSNSHLGGMLTQNNIAAGQSLSFTVANLRSAYALDKMYKLMASAKDGSYSEQMKVRFGIDAPDDDYKCRFIGSVEAPVTIGDVEVTADTFGSDDKTVLSGVGTIKGKGTSLSDGNIDFSPREHGVIIGIFSILPESDYQSNKLDPFVTKNGRSDFFQPEFEDLGKQPVPLCQLNYFYGTNQSIVLGYGTRYQEYKTSVDTIHGVFNSAANIGDKENQSYNAWVAPRNNFNSTFTQAFRKSDLMVRPDVLNQIFMQQYDGSEATDQFLVNANFNVQAIRPMSIFGDTL